MSQESLRAILMTHFRTFALTTSVRGIARAVKAESRIICMLWIFAMFICSIVLMFYLFLTLSKYFSYGVVTNMKEADYNAVFPNITLCKVNQLNELRTDSLNYSGFVRTMQYYKKQLPYKYMRTIMPFLTEEFYDITSTYYTSKNGYFPHLPIDIRYTQTTEATPSPFVLRCLASMWDETPSWDCSSYISSVWNPQYYKCSTITLPQAKKQLVKNIQLILYLNDFDQPIVTYDSFNTVTSTSSSGIWMAVGDDASATNKGLSIGPGTLTTVFLSHIDRKRLEEPYGNCSAREYIGDQSDNIAYTTTACQSVCIQKKRIDDCQCVDLNYLYTTNLLKSTNHTICGNKTSIHENVTLQNAIQAMDEAYCLYNSSTTPPRKCLEDCIQACVDRQYEATVTTSGPWPHPSLHRDFFAGYIRDTSYSSKFEKYAEFIRAYDNESITEEELMQAFGSLDLITKNFLQLNIVISHQRPYIISDFPAMSAVDLVSAVGGMLSLWLGMTAMFVFELLELFYAITKSCAEAKTIVKPQTQEGIKHREDSL